MIEPQSIVGAIKHRTDDLGRSRRKKHFLLWRSEFTRAPSVTHSLLSGALSSPFAPLSIDGFLTLTYSGSINNV